MFERKVAMVNAPKVGPRLIPDIAGGMQSVGDHSQLR